VCFTRGRRRRRRRRGPSTQQPIEVGRSDSYKYADYGDNAYDHVEEEYYIDSSVNSGRERRQAIERGYKRAQGKCEMAEGEVDDEAELDQPFLGSVLMAYQISLIPGDISLKYT